MLPWKLWKCQILPVNQDLSSVYFSLAKFQLVRCNLSLAMIWQITYTHKLPKLCSATLKIHHWIHEHRKSYDVTIKKNLFGSVNFLLKDFTKSLGIFCSKIDLDCYFIERIKHALFKFTSQSCLVTFFRLSNNNSYLSSRYIYTFNSHSMNVHLRNWYIILVTYLVPEHNVKNFHCKFKVLIHMVKKMFLTWYQERPK